MSPAPRTRVALVALVALSACRSSAGEELGLAVFGAASPGWGGGLALAQRLAELEAGDLSFELGGERQALADEGPEGQDLTRAFSGLRLAPRADAAGFQGSLGVSWVRATGDASALDGPGDYGGGHLGLGWSFPLGARMAGGPELLLLYLDAEGDRGGSSAVLEFTWRLVFRP